VDDPSNNVSVPVNAGETKTVSTSPILTQDGQILNVGFDAYDNGFAIDSYKATISVNPTPLPTKTQSPGFVGLVALACLLGAAYLIIRKER